MYTDQLQLILRFRRTQRDPEMSINLLLNGNVVPIPPGFKVHSKTNEDTWTALVPHEGITFRVNAHQPLKIYLHGEKKIDVTNERPKKPVIT